MDITHETTIALEENEINALRTLRDSYYQCIIDDRIECVECPLYVNDICVGKFAERVLDERQLRG